jgi:hypothetical protein
LPLCYLAVGILLVPAETISTNSFAESCRDERSPYRFYDFCLYYAGGKIAASDDRARFYQPDIQHNYLARVRGTDPLPGALVMQYAPFVPVLLALPSMLPGQIAYGLYVAVSALCLSAALVLLFKLVAVLNPDQKQSYALWQKIAVTAAATGSVPFFVTTLLGQMSCILLFLTTAYFYCLFTNRLKAAGIALALTSFKPHYAIFWAIPAVVLKKTKLLLVAAAVEIALIIVACLGLGIEAVLSYPAAILKADNAEECARVAILMVSLRGLLMAGNLVGAAFSLALPAMLVAILAVAAAWRYQANKNADALLIAITVIGCLFFSPHSYIYDALLLVMPILLLARPDNNHDKRTPLAWLLIATPYLQWLGMIFLPINYHRSLPTALILLVGVILCGRRLLQRADV